MGIARTIKALTLSHLMIPTVAGEAITRHNTRLNIKEYDDTGVCASRKPFGSFHSIEFYQKGSL